MSRPEVYPSNIKKNKWGVFSKKGWKCLSFFTTKEEAEKHIKNFGDKKGALYEVRKLDWGDKNK